MQIQQVFERLYQETQSCLGFEEIEIQRMIFNLYSIYELCFYLKQQKIFNLDEEVKAITSFCQNQSVIICKPEKDNVVVFLQ